MMMKVSKIAFSLWVLYFGLAHSGEGRFWLENDFIERTSIPLISVASDGISVCFNIHYNAFVMIEANGGLHPIDERKPTLATLFRRNESGFSPTDPINLPFVGIPQVSILSADARYLVCIGENPLFGGGLPPNCAVFIADLKTKKTAKFELRDFFPKEFIRQDVNEIPEYPQSSIKETRILQFGHSSFLQWFSRVVVDKEFIIHLSGFYEEGVVDGKTYAFPKVEITPREMSVKLEQE